jgi:hypothetical protein
LQPFAERRVKGSALGAGHQASLLEKVFVGTQRHILHTNVVYTKAVNKQDLNRDGRAAFILKSRLH